MTSGQMLGADACEIAFAVPKRMRNNLDIKQGKIATITWLLFMA
jgi:hypothetical protein